MLRLARVMGVADAPLVGGPVVRRKAASCKVECSGSLLTAERGNGFEDGMGGRSTRGLIIDVAGILLTDCLGEDTGLFTLFVTMVGADPRRSKAVPP
jgi:hypothetical protein